MNAYRILGFKMSGDLPNEEVTNEIVMVKYLNLRKKLEELIEKRKYTKAESVARLQESLQELEEAYNNVETEEKRNAYNEPFLKEIQLKTMLGKLIASEGGEPLQKPQKREINKQNRAAYVRKNPNYVEYSPEYEDDNIKLLGIEEVSFENGNMYKDAVKKYMLIVKQKEQHLMEEVLSFYSTNDIDLSDNDHRIALYQALKRVNEESKDFEEKYIGTICKNEDGTFTEIRDGGQIDAMIQREHQKEAERKIKSSRIQSQGEGR